MSILKVIEIMSSSNKSWEDASKKAIMKASKSVNNIRSAWVKDQSISIKNGKVDGFRVTLKVTFELKK